MIGEREDAILENIYNKGIEILKKQKKIGYTFFFFSKDKGLYEIPLPILEKIGFLSESFLKKFDTLFVSGIFEIHESPEMVGPHGMESFGVICIDSDGDAKMVYSKILRHKIENLEEIEIGMKKVIQRKDGFDFEGYIKKLIERRGK